MSKDKLKALAKKYGYVPIYIDSGESVEGLVRHFINWKKKTLFSTTFEGGMNIECGQEKNKDFIDGVNHLINTNQTSL